MTLVDLLLYAQWVFLAAQFIAGGIDIHALKQSIKVLELGTMRADLTQERYDAITEEHDKWMARAHLAKRWMWAMLACTWALFAIILIVTITNPKG